MRIVHIADSMQVGGAETLIALLCRLQRKQGYDPSVYCLYDIGAIGNKLLAESFEVTLRRARTFGGFERSLYLAFRRSRPDVVHCHNANATIISALPARIAGVKSVVATRHGLVEPPYLLRRELKFAVASRFCDWVVAVCDEAKRNLRAAPFAARNRIVRVYNGAAAGSNSGRTPVPKKDLTLLHVGRLSPVKDQESLLRAFALAKCHIPGLKLWIVGDGPLRSRLYELARELGVETVTQFFGEQADVAPFYGAADIFIMSSLSEGLPVSLLEAMAAGLPSIVTNVGGMAEVARLSGAAIVVPVSNYKALANTICEVAEDPCALARLGVAARRCYEQNFTLERMANEYLQLYRHSLIATK